MANLKRNIIELVKEVKEGEIITQTYYTPPFIPLSVTYQAIDLTAKMEKGTRENEKMLIDELVNFVVNDVYKNQFTKEELENGLHAPTAMDVLSEQLLFVARGYQSSETKKSLEKMS